MSQRGPARDLPTGMLAMGRKNQKGTVHCIAPFFYLLPTVFVHKIHG